MNTQLIVDAIKKELKIHGITYKLLAKKLEMSEAGLKKAFAECNFSLKRIEQICGFLSKDLGDLVLAAKEQTTMGKDFPEDVETFLAADPKALYIFYPSGLGLSLSQMCKALSIELPILRNIFRDLETMELVERLPKDKIKLLYPVSTRWGKQGPLAMKYGPRILEVFFKTDFQKPDEYQDFLTTTLSISSWSIIQRKILEAVQLFEQLGRLDATKDPVDTEVYWFYCGIRPWDPLGIID